MDVSVAFDCEDLLNRFEFLQKDRGDLRRKITRAIVQPLKQKARARARKERKRLTGRTAKYTDTWAFKDGAGRLFLGSFYGRAGENDYIIQPKHKKYLMFKIGDKWIKTKNSIFVRGRPIASPVWEEGTSSATMKKIAEDTMDFEFRKWAKK